MPLSDFHSELLEKIKQNLFSSRPPLELSLDISKEIDACILGVWNLCLDDLEGFHRFFSEELQIRLNSKKSEQEKRTVERELNQASSSDSFWKDQGSDEQSRDLEEEIENLIECREDIISKTFPTKEYFLDNLMLLARGSYARKEITASSDIDTGLWIQPSLSEAEKIYFRGFASFFVERLSGKIGAFNCQLIDSNEGLGNAPEREDFQNWVSLLECRLLYGSVKNHAGFTESLFERINGDSMIRYLLEEIESLPDPGINDIAPMNAKGGFRHLHFTLWLWRYAERLATCSCSEFVEEMLKRERVDQWQSLAVLKALNFLTRLRNFAGIRSSESLPKRKNGEISSSETAEFFKASGAYPNVDAFDRARQQASASISEFCEACLELILDKPFRFGEGNIVLSIDYKHGRVLDFELRPKHREGRKSNVSNTQEFLALQSVLLFLAKTGRKPGTVLKSKLRGILAGIEASDALLYAGSRGEFLFRLFRLPNASNALECMMNIQMPVGDDGKLNTLAGYFIPEMNQMPFLLRNLRDRSETLGRHSIEVLLRVERECQKLEKSADPIWKSMVDWERFALKWATFFHDLGKIDPRAEHESHGTLLSREILRRLGFEKNSETVETVSQLIFNHQALVSICNNYLYIDTGILHFLELSERNPRKMLMLFLINHCDLATLDNPQTNLLKRVKTIFSETAKIVFEGKAPLEENPEQRILNYLNGRLDELKQRVCAYLLIRKICMEGIQGVLLEPLQQTGEKAFRKLSGYRKLLEEKISWILMEGIDPKRRSEAHEQLAGILKNALSMDQAKKLGGIGERAFTWFMNALPNRYLLLEKPEIVADCLFKMQNFDNDPFLMVAAKTGENDSEVLFAFKHGLETLGRFAFVLSQRGINIENGKANLVLHSDGNPSYAGFFQLRHSSTARVDFAQIRNEVEKLSLGTLNLHPKGWGGNEEPPKISMSAEPRPSYLVREASQIFRREPFRAAEMKVVMPDAPYCLFKLIKTLKTRELLPGQITITTQNRLVSDYLYFSGDAASFKTDAVRNLLHRYLGSKTLME